MSDVFGSRREQIAAMNKLDLVCDEPSASIDGNLYGYEKALTAAGVQVMAFEQFGSYQGEWWAEIKFPNDEVYYVTGYFGSCSYCDAFDAEFGYGHEEDEPKLRRFGRDYLEQCYTLDQAIEHSSRNLEWDSDAKEMVSWLKSRAV